MRAGDRIAVGKIVWLASYPKSGNTWVRALLTNYLRDTDEPASIDALIGGPIASSRRWFDEWAGIEATALPANVVSCMRADVYRRLSREMGEIRFLKVHDRWRRDDLGRPLFPPDATDRVVYVVRDPRTVAPSYAAHYGIDLEMAVLEMCGPPPQRAPRGPGPQLAHGLGSWSEHVRSWMEESGFPVHVLRYEDLCSAPADALAALLDACGLATVRARVERAVRHSEIRVMRDQERSGGFDEASPRATRAFFHGRQRIRLPSELEARLVDTHGDVMERLGYTAA